MEDAFGAHATPTHSRTVEPHANEVANGTLDGAASDVEVSRTQSAIAHPVAVEGEVVDDVTESLPLPFVAGACLGDAAESGDEFAEDGANLALSQELLLAADPCAQGGRTFRQEALASSPDLFDDVVPVEAGVGEGQVLGLQAPDVVRAIGEKQAGLDAVAALDGLTPKPDEQRFMALEGGVDPLIEGPLAAMRGLPKGVENADEGDLGVLALVAFGSALAASRFPLRTAAMPPRASATPTLLVRAAAPLMVRVQRLPFARVDRLEIGACGQ